MDQHQSLGKLLTNFQGHWSMQLFPENKAPRDWSLRISLKIEYHCKPPVRGVSHKFENFPKSRNNILLKDFSGS